MEVHESIKQVKAEAKYFCEYFLSFLYKQPIGNSRHEVKNIVSTRLVTRFICSAYSTT